VSDSLYRRVKEIFQAAAQRDPSERQVYLDEACKGDEGLRSAVDSLLAAGDEVGSFLEGDPSLTREAAQADEPEPVIGSYHLLEKLGEGGMGEVWLAEQREPVRRKVALKVIKAGMDTSRVVARFEAERQALALMDHPAIAKVFEAGATAAGRPYFVMEHVAGLPITQYCDVHKLPLVERLEVFLSVCDGVQHAHQRAILHRDLKPSNVLVSMTDGRAAAKIIDFGIAKAMAQPLTPRTLHTALGTVVGTPGYMSPEQADSTGQDVDTRTDVYSLGVILYELVVGVSPFDTTRIVEAGWEGLARMLRDAEPVTPSRRLLAASLEQSSESAGLRQTDVPSLRRALAGDLDWITMRAIEPDRQRRYGSPAELAEDIRRHLRDEPVLAGPPGATYRARKFVRRHRVGVAATAVLVMAVTAGLIGTSFGLIRARRAEAEARRQAESSERVSSFLSDVLGSVDADRLGQAMVSGLRDRVRSAAGTRGEDAKAIEARVAAFDEVLDGVNRVDAARALVDEQVLTPAGRSIAEQMASDPLIAARLQLTMGKTYEKLSLHSKAEEALTQAVETNRRLLGREHPETLRSMTALAHLGNVQGQYAEAERIARESLDTQRRTLGMEHPDTLESQSTLGSALVYLGRYDEAERLLRQVLEVERRTLGDDRIETAVAVRVLADALVRQGPKRHVEAEKLYREALDSLRRIAGAEHWETLLCMSNFAILYDDARNFGEAEKYYAEVLATRRRLYGEEDQFTLASMGNLAALYTRQKRYDEAERLQKRAIEGSTRVLGHDHPYTLNFTSTLANLYVLERRYVEAERLHREALAGCLRTLGAEHHSTLRTWGWLGEALHAQRRLAEAEGCYRTAVDGLRRGLGDDHPAARRFMPNLARVYRDQQRYADAKRVYEDLLAIQVRVLGEDDPDTRLTRRRMADLGSPP
jgi:serine/threonine protein kinase/tetratricopeptide (TPR) repeat protein